jgi:Zn-dependent alcohol dehydrogenase
MILSLLRDFMLDCPAVLGADGAGILVGVGVGVRGSSAAMAAQVMGFARGSGRA